MLFIRNLTTLFFLFFTFIYIVAQVEITARLSSEIVPPIVIEEKQQMQFGTFALGTKASAITISTENKRIADGNVKLFEGTYNAAKFSVLTTPGRLLTVALPQNNIHLTLRNPNVTLSLGEFTANIPDSGMFICNEDGTTEVKLGATLRIIESNNQRPHLANAKYDVVFLYN